MFAQNVAMCVEVGCSKQARIKGRCNTHYHTNRNNPSGAKSGTGPIAKLNTEQCKMIKKRSSCFVSNNAIAKEFNVSVQTVVRVLKNEYNPNDQ